MLLELVKGVALLLALSQLYSYSARTLRAYPWASQSLSGVLFGGICVIGMMMPMVLVPGIVFDARSIILSMSSLFGGPWVGTVAVLITAAYRWYLGGAALPVGLGVTFSCYGLGLVYHFLVRRGQLGVGGKHLLVFGILVHAVELGWFALLPDALRMPVIQAVAWPMFLVFAPATVLMGAILRDVSARLDMESALRSQEAHMRATVSAIPDLLYVLDAQGTFLEVLSKAALAPASGGSALVGQRLHDVLPAVLAGALLGHVQRTLERKSTQTFEFDLPVKRGVRRFEGRAHPLAVTVGNARAVVLLARDVTQRSLSQSALRASEARFRSLLQNVGAVAVQGYTPEGIVTYWNAASERLYGYHSAQAVGRNVLDLVIPGSLHARFQAALAEMRHNANAFVSEEWTLMHQSGHEVPVFSSHAAVYQLGEVAEFFRFDIDLSARRLAEAELRVAATAFEAQEGMMVTDAQGVILRVNHAFVVMSGYADHEVIGKKPHLLASGWHDAAFYAKMQTVLHEQGRWEGEIWNRRKNGEIYPQLLHISAVLDEVGGVSHYVATYTDMTQRKEAEDQIRRLAFYDALTGLPNRRLLMDRLQHAFSSSERSAGHGALLFIDLDHFKTLNDTLGHDRGDLLLQQVAQRVLAAVSEEDTVARLGGDEYVVMLEGLDPHDEAAAAQATHIGEKILGALNMPYRLAGHEYLSTASIGVALFQGHAVGADELLKRGDLAMYQAKAGGRNGLRCYDPMMQAAVKQRADLETDIRRALLLGQYVLYYQPQVDAAGQVLGAEALIRWLHPERGVVAPGQFIGVAEDSGQIVMLGSWVLEAACSQLVQWAKQPDTEHLTLAVNVSPRQFRQQDFAEYVLALLDYTGANPKRLKLELTEGLLVDNVDDVIGKMAVLRARGVGFSLDDFGTGYSSLSYLKRLPLDQLKIDQSFVRDVLSDPNDAVIAKTIVALGHSLGLSVIAEGVETLAQQAFLLNNGCDRYQGYLFSPPVPIEAFNDYVRSLQAPRVVA